MATRLQLLLCLQPEAIRNDATGGGKVPMYEDLEPIANLKFGEVVERVSRERRASLSAAISDLTSRGLGHPDSGAMISARLNSSIETSEQLCRGLYEIWLQLLLQRNLGRITREDVNFIMRRVDGCAQAQALNVELVLVTTVGSRPVWAMNQMRTRTESVASGIRRELEIKIREQEAFPKSESEPDLGFVAFLHAFGETWLTKMSGPLTVPF